MEDGLASLEDIFEGKDTASVAPAAKPEPQKQPEAEPAKEPDTTAEQPRDESGRFASKTEQPASTAPAEVTTPVQPAQSKPLVDADQFKGYLEEREKRQAAEKRAEERERELKTLRERYEQQQAQPITFDPNDPDAFASQMQDQLRRTAISTRFDTSEVIARQSHGDDAVQKAMDWGMERSNSSQAFANEYIQQRHPIDWIVKQYKRDQLLSQIGDKDPVEWAKELLAAQTAQPNPQTATPASPQPAPAATPAPTRSLASVTSAGGINSPVDPGLMPLEQVFGR